MTTSTPEATNSGTASPARADHLVIAEPPATGNIDIEGLGIEGDFAVIDVETTGLDAEVDRIVEIGITRRRGGVYERFSSLVNPGFPIPPTAMAVHHITDEDVADAPTIEELSEDLHRMLDGAIPVAHNADLDATFVDRAMGVDVDPTQWLCTYRAARHLMPLAPAFGNQVLRYWLKTNPMSEGLGTHRAMDDVHVTVENLGHVLALAKGRGVKSIADMRDLSQKPILVETMPFGKHAGKKMEEIPGDYFDWALKNMTNLDRDMKGTMLGEIERRAGGPGAAGASTQAGSAAQYTPRMPFGAHKGVALTEVPGDYLKWLVGTNLREQLQNEVTEELARRQAQGQDVKPGAKQPAARPAQSAAESALASIAGSANKAAASAPPAPARTSSSAPAAGAARTGGAQRGNFFAAAQGVADMFGGDDMQAPADEEPEPELQGSAAPASSRPRR